MDIHVEGPRPLGHRLADPAHADDAQPFSAELGAEHLGRVPAGPGVVADHPFAFARPPGGAEQQEQGDVRGRIGQHVGSIGDDQAAITRPKSPLIENSQSPVRMSFLSDRDI